MPREEEGLLRGFAFTVALATFAASLFLLGGFDAANWNFVVDKEWVPAFGIHFKLGLYTMVGSLLMIVAILYLYVRHHDATNVWTFDYDQLMKVVLSPKEQLYCFIAFALAFCIKVPLFPFHTWLPDAHVEAPTAG